MGTSLFDAPDPVASTALLRALSSADPKIREAARRTLAHVLPASVSAASAPPMAHALPPVQAMPGPNLLNTQAPAVDTGLLAQTQPQLTPSAPPTSAVSAMLQSLVANHQSTATPPLVGAPVPPGPDAAGPPPGAPGPAAMMGGGPMAVPPPGLLAPPDVPRGTLMERVKSNLSGLLGDQPQAPPSDAPEYAGLLTPEEIKAAHPGFWKSLGGIVTGAALPSTQFHQEMNRVLKMKELASGMAEHQRIMDFRKTVAAEPPIPEDAPIEKIRNHLARLYDRAAAAGDTEMMKDYGARLTGLFAQAKVDPTKVVGPGAGLFNAAGEKLGEMPGVPKVDTPHVVNAQEGVFQIKPDGLYDVATGQKHNGTVHPISMLPNFSPQTITNPDDPTAPPVVAPFNTKTGAMGSPVATAKPASTKIEGAQAELVRARAEAAVSEMNNATSGMAAFEEKLRNKTANISGLSQFAGSVANTFTHDDPASKAVQSAALAALNRVNPELARYIRRGLSFAEGESMISSRPSDFRTRMSAFLSQAASGASDDMINDIQSRRHSIMTPLNKIYTKGQTPTATVKTPGAVPTYEEWKAAQRKP